MGEPYERKDLTYISDALYSEESDIWLLISTPDINISYSDVMAMTPTERTMATLAIKSILKKRKDAEDAAKKKK